MRPPLVWRMGMAPGVQWVASVRYRGRSIRPLPILYQVVDVPGRPMGRAYATGVVEPIAERATTAALRAACERHWQGGRNGG